jgi:hypothetical protein
MLYSALMVGYYISSGIFLYHWARYIDWFSLFMYFVSAGFGVLFQAIYSKELCKQKNNIKRKQVRENEL